MTPEELVQAALDTAADGMTQGEMPIGAVIEMDGRVIARAHTPDTQLGWGPRPGPLRLAVNLEPCLMCLGAAMALKVTDIYYGLESPADGGSRIAATWPIDPAMPWYRPPAIIGGIHRDRARDQFRRYADAGPASNFRHWARTLADQQPECTA